MICHNKHHHLILPVAADEASAISVQKRPMPAIPTPFTSIGISRPMKYFGAPLPVLQSRAVFYRLRPRSSTSSSDDDIYSEPYCAIQLKSTSKGMLTKQLVRLGIIASRGSLQKKLGAREAQ